MALTLLYAETARNQIRGYLAGIENDLVAIAAGAEVRRELTKLCINPALGTAPTGPFEDRPIFQFRLEAGDKRRLAQVAYRVTAEHIEVLLFSSVPV